VAVLFATTALVLPVNGGKAFESEQPIYPLYKNLLSISRNLLVNDSVPLYLGSWWVYVVMLGIGLGFTIRHLGVEWCLFVLTGGKGQDSAPLVSASSDAPLHDPR